MVEDSLVNAWDTEAAYFAFSNVNDAYLIISRQCNHDMFIHTHTPPHTYMSVCALMHVYLCMQIDTTASMLTLPIFLAKYSVQNYLFITHGSPFLSAASVLDCRG